MDRWRGGELSKPWMTGDIIARHHGVSARTVRRWWAQGMPSRMIGSSRRFRLSDVERWHAEKSAL